MIWNKRKQQLHSFSCTIRNIHNVIKRHKVNKNKTKSRKLFRSFILRSYSHTRTIGVNCIAVIHDDACQYRSVAGECVSE